MGSLASGLQNAVFQVLFAEPVILDGGGGRGKAPIAYPHITFGRTGVHDWATGIEKDSEQLFTLHVWSRARTDEEALGIMGRARALLDGKTMVLEDGTRVAAQLEFAEIRYDEELELRHGLLRFHVTAMPASHRSGRRSRGAPRR